MRRISSFSVFLITLPLFAGCISMAKEYPKKDFFVIDVKRKVNDKKPIVDGLLKISDFRVAEKFEHRGFVYRLGENRYESDYYNLFLVSPSSLFADEMLEWISNASIFDHVVSSASIIDEGYLLEGNVVSFYADYRNSGKPEAVIKIRLMVFKKNGKKYERFFQSEYRETASIKAERATAIIKGYNRALTKIFTKFEADLRGKFKDTAVFGG